MALSVKPERYQHSSTPSEFSQAGEQNK